MSDKGYSGPLEKVNDTLWRIPKRYKAGMRVDGLIYASRELMEHLKADQAPEQVANVAHLPGIQVASLAMPDIHWGYGFPIGGVAATDPEEGGVISPGGVGYDINCLAGDARILHAHGYTRPIAEMSAAWRDARLACYNLSEPRRGATDVALWFGQPPRARVLRAVTETGDELRATADHPFWTPDGMRPLGELRPGDRIALAPFQGVPYELPSEDIIVSEDNMRALLTSLGKEGGNAIGQVLTYLKARGLLPLRASSPALPNLLKVLGFVFGDGTLRFENGNGKGIVAFYGAAADLEAIRADIMALGVTPSRVYTRRRRHHIQTQYAAYEFERVECHFKVVSTGFAALLACLGAPVGNKAQQAYDLPAWLDAAPLWHRRLFLAALFGAELTSPATITGHEATLAAPVLSMNKRAPVTESGRAFLAHVARWLADFGVETQAIAARDEGEGRDGERVVRLRLVLSSTPTSLIALWSRVGFEYNERRAGLAALAVQYLKRKSYWLAQRAAVADAAVGMAEQGMPRRDIVSTLEGPLANERFIERSLYEGRATHPRIGDAFPSFADFCAEVGIGGLSGMVWERVASIEPVDDVDTVYDFTVAHADHNFIANGFVVSNCGVRLVRTNLMQADVAPRLKKLVNRLFEQIPSGVGRSGKYRFERGELRHLMADGVGYLKGRGLATDADIAHTEAGGRLSGAEPKNVSDRALDRGAEQCGTLGSGNHFLEVQVVEEIFDAEAAEAMGLREGMVCVMIHSGSRGLGYQVCDDALHALRNAPQKYGIALPDQQLACAPAHSPEGRHYIGAMRAAANFAWCNRQLLMWQTREVFAEVFGRTWEALDMALIYDVAHNIAKLEEHTINGHVKPVWVHRKGATRAFPPGHPEVPEVYQAVGQPVIIPGDMGRASWVLVGQPGSMQQTFGTTCHGAGRAMSRTASVKQAQGRRIDEELEKEGVIARARSWKGLAEEQPLAYKNVDQVVDVVHRAGLSKEVARMRPIGVIKG
ncbi:MAG: intein-containing RctB family protein [Anaerolineae bacterium]